MNPFCFNFKLFSPFLKSITALLGFKYKNQIFFVIQKLWNYTDFCAASDTERWLSGEHLSLTVSFQSQQET